MLQFGLQNESCCLPQTVLASAGCFCPGLALQPTTEPPPSQPQAPLPPPAQPQAPLPPPAKPQAPLPAPSQPQAAFAPPSQPQAPPKVRWLLAASIVLTPSASQQGAPLLPAACSP